MIAYGVGGATETVVPLGKDHPTGVWFTEPSVSSLKEAILRYEANQTAIQPAICRANAEQYGMERFVRSVQELVGQVKFTQSSGTQPLRLVLASTMID